MMHAAGLGVQTLLAPLTLLTRGRRAHVNAVCVAVCCWLCLTVLLIHFLPALSLFANSSRRRYQAYQRDIERRSFSVQQLLHLADHPNSRLELHNGVQLGDLVDIAGVFDVGNNQRFVVAHVKETTCVAVHRRMDVGDGNFDLSMCYATPHMAFTDRRTREPCIFADLHDGDNAVHLNSVALIPLVPFGDAFQHVLQDVMPSLAAMMLSAEQHGRMRSLLPNASIVMGLDHETGAPKGQQDGWASFLLGMLGVQSGQVVDFVGDNTVVCSPQAVVHFIHPQFNYGATPIQAHQWLHRQLFRDRATSVNLPQRWDELLQQRGAGFVRRPGTQPATVPVMTVLLLQREGQQNGRNIRNQGEVTHAIQSWASSGHHVLVTVHDLAKLRKEETMDLFVAADAVIGIHGGALSNCVFMRPSLHNGLPQTAILEFKVGGVSARSYQALAESHGIAYMSVQAHFPHIRAASHPDERPANQTRQLGDDIETESRSEDCSPDEPTVTMDIAELDQGLRHVQRWWESK